ncbi:MAG TPA: tetratricopeptide repeat protein [Verrucomicrobiae bacterium]|nr:tetratricopeptide repeat protein [Verrucomicrobiae bacterium]
MITFPDILEIQPLAKPPNCKVAVPGSKSITNRALILAALLLARCNPGSAAADVDPRLKEFAKLKHQQTEELAAKLHLDVPPDVLEFFKAAEAGDSNSLSNSYARIQRRTGQPETSIQTPLYGNALSIPVHETRDAYDEFRAWDGTMLQKYADGILHSLPAGCLYFGGTDPGRFIITVVRDVAKVPNIFIITQNGLAERQYAAYLRLIYGRQLSLPTEADAEAALKEYVKNAQARQARGEQLSPDEKIFVEGGAVQVRGVAGVMGINAILSKWVFDHNKDKHGFYVEESYEVPWMYPYLEPHGLIFKLNGEPLAQLDPAVVERDRVFWDKLTKESLADPRFLKNDAARKTYAKLRAAIGGLYAYRHLAGEAEAVYKQAMTLCPASAEASFSLAQLYLEQNRPDDAVAVLDQLRKFDPHNAKISLAVQRIHAAQQANDEVKKLTVARNASPRDVRLVIQLAKDYSQLGQTEKIGPLCDSYMTQAGLSADDMFQIAQLYLSVGQTERSLATLQLITKGFPKNPQPYYSIAIIRAFQGATDDALTALEKAIQLSPALRDLARRDSRLANLRSNPRFQKLVSPTPSQ